MQRLLRHELKYIVPDKLVPVIASRLTRHGMVLDPTNPREYPVTSLYFDTPRLEDYADKAGGFSKRKKIRIRIYEQELTKATETFWLEKKLRYDTVTAKDRVALSRGEYADILNGSKLRILYALKKRGERGAENIFWPLLAEKMRPHVLVRYRRIPFMGSARITLDHHIEACQTNDLGYTRFMRSVHRGSAVLEAKFAVALPFWFENLLREFNLRRTTFSKYAEAVETVYRYHPIPR